MRRFAFIFVPVVALLAACSSSEDSSAQAGSDDRIQVVATTPVIADFVKNLGGDKVDVYDIVKANVDLHDYEPTPADISAIAKADLVVKNGAGLESWFDDTVKAAGGTRPVVDASTWVTLRSSEEEGGQDPHIWHDPNNAKIMVDNITKGLSSAAPASAEVFAANQGTYDAQLTALRAKIAAQIDKLPNKRLVTNHDALGYYVQAYGLDYVGAVIPSFDSQAELSSTQISDLVAKIKAQNVKAVFSESTLPPASAATIAREAGVKVVEGDDALYGDSLGVNGSDAATYIGMEEHNTNAIVTNLE